MLGISGTIGAREVASFNDGWEFKKGPFSKEALQAVQKWNSDWQEVSIPLLECGRHAKASLRFL